MAFYIKPPGGVEKLQNLVVFAKKRLTFLKQVLSCGSSTAFRELLELADTADSSECLIEGATNDRVSHFLLRLACCQDSEMTSFFVRSETELFCHRFANMNSAELIHLLNSTHRFLLRLCQHQAKRSRPSGDQSEWLNYTTVCSDLLKVLQGMIADGLTWAGIVTRYLDGCRSEVIEVPFEYALSLVASRSVVLERGVAKVPLADILKVLAFLFEKLVYDGMRHARHSLRVVVADDDRMVELFFEIRHLYYSGSRVTGVDWAPESGSVTLDDIDNLSTCFPPCMQHLHRMLRKKHRLRHFSRVQYTLFLKEVGLPISEAVKFWQREYSQPHCCHGDSAGCTHDWKRDGRRYTYNIRHLYGLEGSRVNYRAHSCRSIQERSIGYGEEGGCPFSHFDDLHLRNIMSDSGITSELDKRHVIDLAERGKTQAACKAFFRKSVAVSLVHLLKSTQSGGNTTDEEVVDKKDFDETDTDLLPCSKKKPRLGLVDIAEARLSKEVSMECASNKINAANQNETHMSLPRPEIVSAPESLIRGPNWRDPYLTEEEPPSSIAKDTMQSKVHMAMYQVTSSIMILQIPGEDDIQSACNSSTGGGSSASKTSVQVLSKEHRQIHKENSSKPVHNSLEDCKDDKPTRALTEGGSSSATPSTQCMHQSDSSKTDSDAPSSRSITILRNVQIQKPVDYYRSYIQLLGSLQQMEGSDS